MEIRRGMPEAEVRAYLPLVNCDTSPPDVEPPLTYCGISDGVPPEQDGEIYFESGLVRSATRNWFVPIDASPAQTLAFLHQHLTRLTGPDTATCAKIETHGEPGKAYTLYAFPAKVLVVREYRAGEQRQVVLREKLRVNPVPRSYATRGRKRQGTEWCAYLDPHPEKVEAENRATQERKAPG